MDLQEETFTFIYQEDTPKKRLADPVTTPKRGPLLLAHSNRQSTHPVEDKLQSKQQVCGTRQRGLNRLPVSSTQRPIDAIEDILGEVSVVELKQQAITDWSVERHTPILPTLNPLMKYTPIGRSDLVRESHIHKASGPMDILITYSRHTMPRSYLPQEWVPQNIGQTHLPVSQNRCFNKCTRARTSLSTRRSEHFYKTGNQTFTSLEMDYPLLSPRQQPPSHTGQLIGGLIRPTIAPHGVHAVAIHKFKPVTAQTILQGQGLHPYTHFIK